jgi:hypothetical protein
MREVDRPVKRPMHCAALPYVGQSNRGERWVDTGSELPGGFDNHVYLSGSAVRAAMDALGWPTPGEFREMRAERDLLAEQLAQAQEELAELRKLRDGIDVIESAGFRARRKPGRPPKEMVA